MKCRQCHAERSNRQFYKRSDGFGYSRICKLCARAYSRRRTKEFPAYSRARLLKRYGLTVGSYELMVAEQNGKCAICLEIQTKPMSVDHHHASGKVRALLCRSCNALIGMTREDERILMLAIEYLRVHKLDKQANAI